MVADASGAMGYEVCAAAVSETQKSLGQAVPGERIRVCRANLRPLRPIHAGSTSPVVRPPTWARSRALPVIASGAVRAAGRSLCLRLAGGWLVAVSAGRLLGLAVIVVAPADDVPFGSDSAGVGASR